jgi:hypothetical protein
VLPGDVSLAMTAPTGIESATNSNAAALICFLMLTDVLSEKIGSAGGCSYTGELTSSFFFISIRYNSTKYTFS